MRLLILTLAAAASACGGASSAAPGHPGVAIHDIQGPGAASPYDGKVVTTTGVVTGDFQDGDDDAWRDLGGFFVQSPEPDGDPLTSEGLFVFERGRSRTDVAVGDLVEVTGTVTEYFGETQLAASAVRVKGRGSVQPVDVALPAAGTVNNTDGALIADLEHLEGMLVHFPQALTVSSLFTLERYGDIGLVAGGRWRSFTSDNPPDVDGFAAHNRAFAAAGIILDDGRRGENETPLAWFGDDGQTVLRVGDAVIGLTGNLRYSRGSGASGIDTYRVMPVGAVRFESLNPRPALPHVEGSLRIAAYNSLNFFSTIDEDGAACGPDGRGGCRGADSAAEFSRQAAKAGTAIAAIDADIVSLSEIENNGGESLQKLVEAVNARSDRDYRFIHTGIVGSDAITTGIIYDARAVTPVGNAAIIDERVDPRFDTSRSRPSIAQSFRERADGGVLTVVTAHLKSKSSSCADDGDPDLGDGQGNCSVTRTRAAAALADWLAADPTGSGDPDFIILGDFNAYQQGHPLAALREAGLVNLLDDQDDAYSYVFGGRSGALDHAFVSESLLPQVAGIAEWHINADEPPARDYNLVYGRDPSLFDPDSPYRSGDHDPLIVGLRLAN
jgi:predicted extracellular nuclease